MTRARGGTAEAIDNAVATVRAVLGADDVCLWQTRGASEADPPSTVRAADLDVRGGWRLAVVRDRPTAEAEDRTFDSLAAMLGCVLAVESEADLASRLADMVDATMLQLDGMIGATVEERLVKVARDLAEVIDARAWSVRLLVEDSWAVVADEHRRGRFVDGPAGWAPLDPRALELDEGSMAVGPGDDGQVADALRSNGLTSLVGAIGYDPDAVSWTLCMVGDDVSGDLSPGRTALAALVPAALGFPLPPRAGGLLRHVG